MSMHRALRTLRGLGLRHGIRPYANIEYKIKNKIKKTAINEY